MCVLSIKVPIRKKSGNLFNDPRIYIYACLGLQYIFCMPKSFIYIYMCVCVCVCVCACVYMSMCVCMSMCACV